MRVLWITRIELKRDVLNVLQRRFMKATGIALRDSTFPLTTKIKSTSELPLTISENETARHSQLLSIAFRSEI